ncbi:MAG: exported protein [Naasia sp.]|nr:exported protein [Naasia sp.]
MVCGHSQCPPLTEMAWRAVEEQPDVVVVAGGQNDTVTAYNDPLGQGAAIDETFLTRRAGLPRACVVAVGPKPLRGVTEPLLAIEERV